MAGNQPKHPRHHYAKFKDPPNDRVRIEMFLEAISDYASLQATFPLPEFPSEMRITSATVSTGL
ncbi:hypothetical protein E3T25_02145 [Cryobacterium sandaracinum]|uniref:Uncharacterized protein n=1 Tax=Cryobacterium sandaracinum TaxID=1259247 RepID=A0ABY2JIG2_9MICO|nr:hypothetical protein [Cryobacterium sandaracinum]TFD06362.1 hypothetical protein E3T25_02145 [Cryobacterium sandaracinum]